MKFREVVDNVVDMFPVPVTEFLTQNDLKGFAKNADITRLLSCSDFIDFMGIEKWENQGKCIVFIKNVEKWCSGWRERNPNNYDNNVNNFTLLPQFSHVLSIYENLLTAQVITGRECFQKAIYLSLLMRCRDETPLVTKQVSTFDFSKVYKGRLEKTVQYVNSFLKKIKKVKTIPPTPEEYLKAFKKCRDIDFICAFVDSNKNKGSVENCVLWLDFDPKFRGEDFPNFYPVMINAHDSEKMREMVYTAIDYAVSYFNKAHKKTDSERLIVRNAFFQVGKIFIGEKELKRDGNSIGAAIYCAALSLFYGRGMPRGVFYTGQTGTRLKIKGEFEKARAGGDSKYHTFVLPEENNTRQFQKQIEKHNINLMIRTYRDMSQLANLLDELYQTVDKLSPNRSVLPSVKDLPEFSRLNYRSMLDGFIGRVDILWKTHFLLQKNTTVVLNGMPGVGKSQAAIEYARRFGFCYPGMVFWIGKEDYGFSQIKGKNFEDIAMANVSAIISKWIGFENDNRLEGKDQLRLIWEKIKKKKKSTLIILDNFPEYGCLSSWLPYSNIVHVLVTSRSIEHKSSKISNIEINVLNPSEAIELLERSSKKTFGQQANKLSEMLGYLPLALDLAGNYLKNSAKGIYSLIEEIKKTGELAQLQKFANTYREQLPSEHSKDIAGMFELCIRQVENADKQYMAILETMSLLSPIPVPLRLLEKFLNFEKQSKFSETTLLDMLTNLKSRFSLIDINDGTEPYIHRLLLLYLRNRLEHKTSFKNIFCFLHHILTIEVSIRNFFGFFFRNTPKAYEKILLIKTVVVFIDELDNDFNDAKGMLYLTKTILHAEYFKNTHIIPQFLLYKLLVNLGNRNFNLMRLNSAKEAYKQALFMKNTHFCKDVIKEAEIKQNISLILHYFGGKSNLKKAESLMREVVKICTSNFDKKNIRMVVVKSNLAHILKDIRDKEKQDEAEQLMADAVKKFIVFLDRHSNLYDFTVQDKVHIWYPSIYNPHIAKIQSHLAMLLIKFGAGRELRIAKRLMSWTLKINIYYYGKKHPIVSETQCDLSMIMQSLDDTESILTAKNLLIEALETDIDFFGAGSLQVARDKAILAIVLRDLGGVKHLLEAASLIREALKVSIDRFGIDSPQTKLHLSYLTLIVKDKDYCSALKYRYLSHFFPKDVELIELSKSKNILHISHYALPNDFPVFHEALSKKVKIPLILFEEHQEKYNDFWTILKKENNKDLLDSLLDENDDKENLNKKFTELMLRNDSKAVDTLNLWDSSILEESYKYAPCLLSILDEDKLFKYLLHNEHWELDSLDAKYDKKSNEPQHSVRNRVNRQTKTDTLISNDDIKKLINADRCISKDESKEELSEKATNKITQEDIDLLLNQSKFLSADEDDLEALLDMSNEKESDLGELSQEDIDSLLNNTSTIIKPLFGIDSDECPEFSADDIDGLLNGFVTKK